MNYETKFMKLYLDNSFLNRPFDNPNIESNKLESEILFLIIGLIREKNFILVNSSVIEYENSLNPFPERKSFIEEILKLAKVYQNANEKIKRESMAIEKRIKLQAIDSLHIATAEFSEVDFFITCDYNLVRKYEGSLKVITPLDFIKYYEKHYR